MIIGPTFQMEEVMFERFNVPAMYIDIMQQVMTLYAYGRYL